MNDSEWVKDIENKIIELCNKLERIPTKEELNESGITIFFQRKFRELKNVKTIREVLIKQGFRDRKSVIINDKVKSANEVNFEELEILIRQFIQAHNRTPFVKEFNVYNNLINGVKYSKMLKENNISHKQLTDKINSSVYYETYKDKYIKTCIQENKVISSKELVKLNLKDARWYIRNCNNKNVKTFNDFINFETPFCSNTQPTKEKVIQTINNMQSVINRPLTYDDFRNPSIYGVGITIICRYWGTMNQMKEELGIKINQEDMLSKHIDDIDTIKSELDYVCQFVGKYENRLIITRDDIEKFNRFNVKASFFDKNLKQNGTSTRKYIESIGFKLQNSGAGLNYTFEDGEKVDSKYEYEFSRHLKNVGLVYNKDYYRNVKYNSFVSDINSGINCDYVIKFNNQIYYIEIAGMLRDYKKHYYMNKSIKSNIREEYRIKLMNKEKILKENNLNYHILFPEDINENNTIDFISVLKI